MVGVGFVTVLSEAGGSILASRRMRAPAHGPAERRCRRERAQLRRPHAVEWTSSHEFCTASSRQASSSEPWSSTAASRRRGVILPGLALTFGEPCRVGDDLAVRPLADADGSWWLVLLQAALVTVFVARIEGLFYAMIPITFMDGATVFEWNKLVWALLFGAATFLFWHLLLNQNDAYLDALRQTRVRIALGLVLLYGGLTVADVAVLQGPGADRPYASDCGGATQLGRPHRRRAVRRERRRVPLGYARRAWPPDPPLNTDYERRAFWQASMPAAARPRRAATCPPRRMSS